MKASNSLPTTSFLALLTGLGAVAFGSADVEPMPQAQPAHWDQAPSDRTNPVEAMRHESNEPQDRTPDGWRWQRLPSPEKTIARFDTNHDGALDAAELPSRM